MDHKNVWVFIEVNEKNIAENVGLELLNPARMIANDLNQDLVAIVIGNKVNDIVEELKEYNVDEIIVVDNEIYYEYNTEVYANALSTLCEKYKPNTMLIGATNKGRDLGPRVASRLNAGLTADCTELSVEKETGNVLWSRPTFGGNLMATIISPNTRPQIGTIRPSVFNKKIYTKNNDVNIKYEDIVMDIKKIRTKVIKKLLIDTTNKVDLKESKIIIGVGLGIENAKNFSIIEELADLIGADIAYTRAIVDAGFKDHTYQVGQSGQTVSPDIYIAIGISGAIQHISGMSNSKTIIAINKDPNANIFKIADYGIVGDLFEIVPKLIDEIKSKE